MRYILNSWLACFLIIFFIAGTEQLAAQCVSGNCNTGFGTMNFSNGAKYVGQFRGGAMSGVGTMYYADGSFYQGEVRNGYPNGKGMKIATNGQKDEGIWRDGNLVKGGYTDQMPIEHQDKPGCVSGNCFDGKGVYIFPSGSLYVGEFANGEIHGKGACYYASGNKYEGQWAHRYPDGKGTMTYPDGTRQTGYWQKGNYIPDSGKLKYAGTYDEEDQETFLQSHHIDVQWGCILGDCENGTGKFVYKDGSKWEGSFRDGQPHGSGTFYTINQYKYVGEFQDGLPHGKAKVYRVDGSVFREGYWKYGEYVGKDPNAIAIGQWGCSSGDCENGYGYYRFQNGNFYYGLFQNGQPNGNGMMIFPNGDRYAGSFSNGRYHGEGTLYVKNGSDKEGFWRDGIFVGADASAAPATPSSGNNQQPSDQQNNTTQQSTYGYNQNTGTPSNPHSPPSAGAAAAAAAGNLPRLKIYALIIGVADYRHMPVLRYTDDDAYRVYSHLRSPEGGGLPEGQIRILIDEDANRENIMKVGKELFGQANENDLVFLYFSGHGIKGAFLPSDYDGRSNQLLHSEINQFLARSPAKYKVIIADACHSGSLFSDGGEFTARGASDEDVLNTYYTTLSQAAAGSALIMSSKGEETSLESNGLRQGVFTHFLIRGLKGEADGDFNNIVTVQELFNYVESNVISYTRNRQSPMIDGDYDPNMTVAITR